MTEPPALITRATDPAINRARTLAATLRDVKVSTVVGEYMELVTQAPRRGADGYEYFIARSGAPGSGGSTNRYEEQLAMAMANDSVCIATGSEDVDILMYAFPVFTKGGPKGTRGVDLVGHSRRQDRFWVVELKVARGSGRGESPLRALCEALIYSAIIEANASHVYGELLGKYLRSSRGPRPGLMIVAPSMYWSNWTSNARVEDWWPEFQRVTTGLAEQLETPLEIVDLGDLAFESGPGGRPNVVGSLEFRRVAY